MIRLTFASTDLDGDDDRMEYTKKNNKNENDQKEGCVSEKRGKKERN